MAQRGVAIGLACALVTVAATGCGDDARSTPTTRAGLSCPVTLPAGRLAGVPRGFDHGARALAVVLWPRGELVAGKLPDGGIFATVDEEDGSIGAKVGWWHATPGVLRITGRRLDANAPPLSAQIPSGYGDRGFQPTGLTFPTQGCWRVRGQVGAARLEFVARVRTL